MANNLGDQILKTVDEILNSGNFEKLNSVVSDTVIMAMDEVRKQMEKPAKAAARTYIHTPQTKIRKVGNVAGVLLQVFGSIGAGIFGFSAIGFFIAGFMGAANWDATLVFAALSAVSGLVIASGAAKCARWKRAQRYVQLMQGKAYNNIYDLALLANKSERYVRKDLKNMIAAGIFPEGHLNEQEDCFIMGDVAYREYIRMERLRKGAQLEAAEQKRIEMQSAEKTEAVKAGEASHGEELNAVIEEGNTYIKKFRGLNDLIEGEVVSEKLYRLENVLREIFAQLKKYPEQIPEMHKFMEYYLPTTLKLVAAYEEFDRVSVPGEDILSSKKEIEKTLDTINAAFEELLNKLFRSKVYDVTTDAQVLKTMLAREGLTKEPVFTGRKEVENG